MFSETGCFTPQTEQPQETATTGDSPVSTAPVDSRVEDDEVAAAANAKKLEEEAAAELIRLAELTKKQEEEKDRKRMFEEEVARRKIAQATKPKEKGIEIKEAPKPSIPTYKGKGKRKMDEVESDQESTPGPQTSAEKKFAQIDSDVVIAEQAERAWAEEVLEQERMKKKKEADKKRSKKFIAKNTKKEADRDKFMSYLKQTGKYSGKQLGPMKMSTLLELYDKERKIEKEVRERKRYEEERRRKEAFEKRAREVEAEEAHEALKRKNSRKYKEVNTDAGQATDEPAETRSSVETPSKKQKTHESTSSQEEEEEEEKKRVSKWMYRVMGVDDAEVDLHAN